MPCPRWGSNPRPWAILRFLDIRILDYFIIIILTNYIKATIGKVSLMMTD